MTGCAGTTSPKPAEGHHRTAHADVLRRRLEWFHRPVDAHLALARVYVYSLSDPEKAMAEFATAERLGATLGRREIQQQGDAYRLRAQSPLPASSRQAVRDAVVRDAAAARAFYQRIPGFDEVDDHMRELDRIQAPAPRKTKTGRYNRWR